MHCGK